MKIKVICIKDCGESGDCVLNNLYLCDSWILDKNIPCVYEWEINNVILSCYNIYDMDGKMKGMFVANNFIKLSEFRENRINSILDEN